MEDIGKELYDQIAAEFEQTTGSDSVIRGILERISKGTAQPADIALYAQRLGLWLREAIDGNISADKLPNGQMYYNIAEKILRPSLKTTNEMFNAVAAEIQTAIDKKQGIRIKPQNVDLPEERIDDLIGAVSEPGISEEIMRRRMTVPPETITRSYADDYARGNADFRSRAGIDEYIVRRDDGNCCEWCSKLAGKYRYPEQVPKDVYRRHDNCGCTVEHVSSGMRKNIHTKRSGTEEQQREALRELDERKREKREKAKAAAANAKKPRVLSKAEGSRIEADVLAKRRALDPKTGELLTVSADMTYRKWYGKYVEENDSFKAKNLSIFNDRSAPVSEYISSEQVYDNMQTSDIGREFLKYAESLPEPIEFDYNTYIPGVRGECTGKKIVIYMKNEENYNALRVARTVIHELTHYRYGIGDSQWSECVCIAHELMHKYDRRVLTFDEKKRIIKAVKGDPDYSKLNWRKGGMIHGRRKSNR